MRIRVQVDDVETTVDKAVKAGALLQGEIGVDETACGGGALGNLVDPFGVSWIVVSPAKTSEAEAWSNWRFFSPSTPGVGDLL